MKGKKIIPLVMTALVGTVVAAPIQSLLEQKQVKAEAAIEITNVVGEKITVKGFKATGTLGENVQIPAPEAEAGVTYEVEVYHAKTGKIAVAEVKDGDTLTGWNLKLNFGGIYRVKYFAKSAGKITSESETYTITVKTYSYSLTLPENSYFTVPTILPTGTAVKFPAPVVDIEEGGAEGEVVVEVRTTSPANTVTLTKQTDAKYGDYYSYTTANNADTFTVYYNYKVGGEVVDYTFSNHNVRKDYNVDNLGLTFEIPSASWPSTATLGVPVSLPKTTAKASDGASIATYFNVRAYHIPSNDVENLVYEGSEYSFTPALAGTYRVYYDAIVNYGTKQIKVTRSKLITNVKDGQVPTVYAVNSYEFATAAEITSGVKNVQGIKSVGGKTITELGIDTSTMTLEEQRAALLKAMGDLSHAVPSIAEVGNTITLPAIYSQDNYSVLGDTSKNLTIRREWAKEDGSTSTVEVITGDTFAATTFDLSDVAPGNYVIRYVAEDSSVGGSASVSETVGYAIQVVASGSLTASTPKLTAPTINSSAYPGDTITFDAPVYSDTYDSRLSLVVAYSYDGTDWTALTANKEGKYSVSIPSDTSSTTLKIKIDVVNDFRNDASKTMEVSILNVTEDKSAPTIDTTNFLTQFASLNNINTTDLKPDGTLTITGKAAFGQQQVINLPAFSFKDKGETLEVKVTVIRPNGKEVSLSYGTTEIEALEGDFTKYTIPAGTFVTTVAGYYKVIYSAIDGNGNLVTQTFGIKVRSTQGPQLVINAGSIVSTLEMNEYYELPAITLYDMGGEEIDFSEDETASSMWKVTVIEGKLVERIVNGKLVGFTPSTHGGVYKIQAVGTANGITVTSQERELVCKDSIQPVITLEKEYKLDSKIETYNANEDIVLPNVEVTDKNNNHITDYTSLTVEVKKGSTVVPVTTKTAEEAEAAYIAAGDSKPQWPLSGEKKLGSGVFVTRYSFKPTAGEGKYTITYTATDKAGNVSTYVTSISIGDDEAPVLEWVNKEKDLVTELKVGDTYELNLDFFEIKDKDTENMSTADYLNYITNTDRVNIYLRDPDGNTKTNMFKADGSEGYKWTFDKAGKYTLHFVLKDSKGNSSSITPYTITVAEEKEGEEKEASPVLGTTLIVIASVLVAGVIVYFVVTGIKGSPKSKKRVVKAPKDKIVK